jgi:hypothetical protein
MPTEVERDAVTGTETTGHEWDGIRELDTPLPRWWLWLFYATIAWSLVYFVLYPSFPTLSGYAKGVLGWSMRAEFTERMADARAAQKPSMFATFPPLTSTPSPPAGKPTSSAIHRTVCSSISLAIGERLQPPTFWFTAEARRSPSIPSGAAPAVMYPKKRGWAL